MDTFAQTLTRHGLKLVRGETETLQVNVGLACNQACRHCHLEAGPERAELMSRETMAEVAAFAARSGLKILDITGGAPEMNPRLADLIQLMRPLMDRIMLRANLTAILAAEGELLATVLENRVDLVGSLPAVNPGQTDGQRGRGIFDRSIETLRQLNSIGYGKPGGPRLDLVSNPAGAFLPPDQCTAEARFRTQLEGKYGIVFNSLFTFANVPLGRFKTWLQRSGNYETYLKKLADGFNPLAVDGLMCRSLISVGWDGTVYDCDFNQAAGLPLSGKPLAIRDLPTTPEKGSRITISEHCYTCTAGSGFT